MFGLTAALELKRRGIEPTVLERGPVPHPDAASTDVSKLVRLDYGEDELYTEMAEESAQLFAAWDRRAGERLYHDEGLLMLTRSPMQRGELEHDSMACLSKRGHAPKRVDASWLREHAPAFAPGALVDGYLSPVGGYIESGALVSRLAREAAQQGISIRTETTCREVVVEGGRALGVATESERLFADVVLVAQGALSPSLLPWLADIITPVGQPVFLFAPSDVQNYQSPLFWPWAIDIKKTGFYGFPATPEGLVKVANHGPGQAITGDGPRVVAPHYEALFRGFLASVLPSLATAKVARTRLCLYADTPDGDFLIDQHPSYENLFVATGDSGHGFKFAPVLGPLIADVMQGKSSARTRRFAKRPFAHRGHEASRWEG